MKQVSDLYTGDLLEKEVRRGRPLKPNKLSVAQRVAKHREKKKQLNVTCNENSGNGNMNESEELEQEAIKLWRENRFFLSLKPEAKKFFRRVAEFNQWEKLAEELRR